MSESERPPNQSPPRGGEAAKLEQLNSERQRVRQNLRRLVAESVQSEDFDDLTVREVKLRVAQETEKLAEQRPAASVITIVILIVDLA